MNKKTYLLLALTLMSSSFLVSCKDENKKIEKNEQVENIEVGKSQTEEIEIPKISQQIDRFPWEDDLEFIKAKEENNTDVLIAGFCNVLEKSTPEERENIGLAVRDINGTVIGPGEVFSQNEVAGPYTEEKGYKEGSGYLGSKIVKSVGGGVCKVATTLYNTAILSDLDIVERYNHTMPVPYVPYGQDAAIAFGSKDLKFKNNTDSPILIWIDFIDNKVYMGFYGKEEGPQVEWEHETLSTRPAYTEYKINPELKDGDENVLVEGMQGEVVKSKVIVKDKDGNEKIKDLGKSSYWPMPTLIEKNK